MIIDNPHIYRQIIEETKPYFTHQGAEEIVNQMKVEMDAYAHHYGILAERVWKEEYACSGAVGTSVNRRSKDKKI